MWLTVQKKEFSLIVKSSVVKNSHNESLTALSFQSDQQAPPKQEGWGLVSSQEATLITVTAVFSFIRMDSRTAGRKD